MLRIASASPLWIQAECRTWFGHVFLKNNIIISTVFCCHPWCSLGSGHQGGNLGAAWEWNNLPSQSIVVFCLRLRTCLLCFLFGCWFSLSVLLFTLIRLREDQWKVCWSSAHVWLLRWLKLQRSIYYHWHGEMVLKRRKRDIAVVCSCHFGKTWSPAHGGTWRTLLQLVLGCFGYISSYKLYSLLWSSVYRYIEI